MGTPIGQVPTPFELRAVQVGRPVSSAHLLRAAEECGFHGGHNLQTILACRIHPRNVARSILSGFTAWDVPWCYRRHPGAQVVAVVVTATPVAGALAGASYTLTVNLPAGASWIDAGVLDGAAALRWPPTGRVAPQEFVGLVDVTGLTAGALSYWSVSHVPSATLVGQGTATVRMFEISRASADPTGDPTGDPTWEQAAAVHPNPLEDGGASSPRGLTRFAHLLDTYREGFKPHVQISGPETTDNSATATNPHWHREGVGAGALEWQYSATGAHDTQLYWQVRNLYGVGASAPSQSYTLVVRYKTSGAVAGQLDLYLSGLPGGTALAVQSVALAATSDVWTWLTAPVTVPADGTAGLAGCRFEADSGGAGEVLQFACIALIDAQT